MSIVKTHKNGGKLIGNFRAKKLFSIIIAYSLEKFKIVWYNYKSEERESSPPIVYAFVAQLDRALASDARCRRFESCQAHQGIHAITWVLFFKSNWGSCVCWLKYSGSKRVKAWGRRGCIPGAPCRTNAASPSTSLTLPSVGYYRRLFYACLPEMPLFTCHITSA